MQSKKNNNHSLFIVLIFALFIFFYDFFVTPLFSDAECSLAHAEMREDVSYDFVGGDFSTCDFGESVEGESEVFGK